MRIIIGTDRVQELTGCYKATLGDIAFPDNHLPCIGNNLIGVDIEITGNTIDLYGLIDIP